MYMKKNNEQPQNKITDSTYLSKHQIWKEQFDY